MKITAFGKTGKKLKVGTKWYALSSAVQGFMSNNADNFKMGQEVRFDVGEQDRWGNDVIVKIQSVSGSRGQSQTTTEEESEEAETEETPATTSYPGTSNARGRSGYQGTARPRTTSWGGKSPQDQENIKRLSVLRAVGDSLTSMQGHIDPNNVQEIAQGLYEFYYGLVSA